MDGPLCLAKNMHALSGRTGGRRLKPRPKGLERIVERHDGMAPPVWAILVHKWGPATAAGSLQPGL